MMNKPTWNSDDNEGVMIPNLSQNTLNRLDRLAETMPASNTQNDQTARQMPDKKYFECPNGGDDVCYIRADLAAIQFAPPVTEEETPFMVDVATEIARSKLKFPTNEHKLTALFEEAGEVANAFLEHKYGKAPAENIRKECVQLAAMAWRCAEEGDHSFPYAGTAPQPPADVSENVRALVIELEAVNYELGYEDGKSQTNIQCDNQLERRVKAQYAVLSALTRAKSDERVVSQSEAQAALSAINICPYGVPSHRDSGDLYRINKTIRTLLAHAAGLIANEPGKAGQ